MSGNLLIFIFHTAPLEPAELLLRCLIQLSCVEFLLLESHVFSLPGLPLVLVEHILLQLPNKASLDSIDFFFFGFYIVFKKIIHFCSMNSLFFSIGAIIRIY